VAGAASLFLQGLEDMVSKLGPLMYWNGKGELITRTDYMRWKYRNNKVSPQVTTRVETKSDVFILAKREVHIFAKFPNFFIRSFHKKQKMFEIFSQKCENEHFRFSHSYKGSSPTRPQAFHANFFIGKVIV
jgi:hypothetical protein